MSILGEITVFKFDNLNERWEYSFNFLDLNDHGFFDIQGLCQVYERLFGMNEADKSRNQKMLGGATAVKKAIRARYGEEKLTVTRDEMVQTWAYIYLKDPQEFHAIFYGYFNAAFDVLDPNDLGYITFDQYVKYILRYGDNQEMRDHATRAFQVMTEGSGDPPGQLTRETFVKSYLKFFSDPDIKRDDLPLY